MFIGDLFRTSDGKITPMYSLMNWNNKLQKESISKINKYHFNWICPAHGEPIRNKGQINEL